MRRDDRFAESRWDEPFWHVVRMVVDVLGKRKSLPATGADVRDALSSAATEGANGLLDYIGDSPDVFDRIADYLAYRTNAAERLEVKMLRTEDEALADLAALSDAAVTRYGTLSADHHQSPKVMVATVETLTRLTCGETGTSFNANPQSRAVAVGEGHLWVSPRRLDGALPDLLNPAAIWEIKEYWGKKNGGSKMSDAIYECQLVGLELRAFQDLHGIHVGHYVLLDGLEQWKTRRSDLRRAIDLLCAGLIDELIVGREVLTEWPRIVSELAAAC